MTIHSVEWLCLSRLMFMTCLSALLPKRLLLTTLVKETVITGTTRSTAYWLYFNASTTDNIKLMVMSLVTKHVMNTCQER